MNRRILAGVIEVPGVGVTHHNWWSGVLRISRAQKRNKSVTFKDKKSGIIILTICLLLKTGSNSINADAKRI